MLAGEHENRTHLPQRRLRNNGFEVRDGHQLRTLSRSVEGRGMKENRGSMQNGYERIILETLSACNGFFPAPEAGRETVPLLSRVFTAHEIVRRIQFVVRAEQNKNVPCFEPKVRAGICDGLSISRHGDDGRPRGVPDIKLPQASVSGR